MTITPAEMPFKRGPGCDLCGVQAPLRRVVLSESSGSAMRNYRCPRVAYICDAHGDPSGEPVRKPATVLAPGTSRLAPQSETLL